MTDDVKSLFTDVLQVDARRTATWSADTRLLGALPELDSMAIANLLVAIEERFGITIPDDELSSEVFETFGALCSFIDQMAARKSPR